MTEDELMALATRCIRENHPVMELVHALAQQRRTLTAVVLFGEGGGVASGMLKDAEAKAGRFIWERNNKAQAVPDFRPRGVAPRARKGAPFSVLAPPLARRCISARGQPLKGFPPLHPPSPERAAAKAASGRGYATRCAYSMRTFT